MAKGRYKASAFRRGVYRSEKNKIQIFKINLKLHVLFMLPLHICISEYQINIYPKPNKTIMKTKILVAGALLFTASAFAQTSDNTKNKQGASVSSVAKSKTEANTKETTVSSTASAKSQASVNRKNQTTEERRQRKADRSAARNERKQEHKDFVAGIKSENEARKEEHSAVVKSEVEARKELLNEYKDNVKEAKQDAKAERKASDEVLKAEGKTNVKLDKPERKTQKTNRPVKVKAGTDVKLRRPNGAKVHGSAGLGLGIL